MGRFCFIKNYFPIFCSQHYGNCRQYRCCRNPSSWSRNNGDGPRHRGTSGQRRHSNRSGRLASVSERIINESWSGIISSYNCMIWLFRSIFSDRFRTSVNVVGDSLGAGIVNHLSRNELALLPHNSQAQNGSDRHTTSIWESPDDNQRQ